MDTLEFNTIKTVGTINKDKMLQSVYKQKFGTYTPAQLTQAAKANQLADKTIDFLKDMFENVIKSKEDLVKTYQSISEPKTPRRYGKVQIEKDIKTQNGLVSPLQRTMLKIADAKRVICNLADKGVSDHYKGTQNYSKDDLKDLNAAIRDFINKVEPITKRKK